ncbi:MAG: DUF1328 domain-containing protein [Planctomycetes bacterium RBG_13_62_9]|nr:MAG: DUF1328 domain-containing protein [Planctomycetes bacterium RBG_13_62_9]
MGLLGWALVFFVIVAITAVFGFGGVATAAAGTAKLLFIVFLTVFVILFLAGLFGGGAAAA